MQGGSPYVTPTIYPGSHRRNCLRRLTWEPHAVGAARFCCRWLETHASWGNVQKSSAASPRSTGQALLATMPSQSDRAPAKKIVQARLIVCLGLAFHRTHSRRLWADPSLGASHWPGCLGDVRALPRSCLVSLPRKKRCVAGLSNCARQAMSPKSFRLPLLTRLNAATYPGLFGPRTQKIDRGQ
jgi:hypothetical protein